MSRHSKQIYEDVAEVFHGEATVDNLAHDFADLFAADNPPRCVNCGEPATTTGGGSCHYVPQLGEHNFEGGFDRERFLAACGLTTETEVRHGL
ncbi:hypothetical protein LCGC14_3076430 [marine sediment metagenome]|uniref:Uncharacterized protein n=1 Tax=marine sediment metagenome TaxID=412755 RepID=A0A0F8WEF1_9ZZZZ